MGSNTPVSFGSRSLGNAARKLSSSQQTLSDNPSRPAADLVYNSSDTRSRYEAYSRLQASAVAFGEKLPIPEIVAIGGQSDGKSSLLEALLGFRFNVREVEMGTRRPLMLQMVHDPNATEPRCRLQEEDSDEYGPTIVPVSNVAEAIKKRTEEYLKKLHTAVSAKPIVMRAEYAYCPNLTIIDTPGFVLKAKKGDPESTPDDILAMVKGLAAPQHRLLLFLQQSSVEWCSSLWLDVVRAIDPSLQRTIIVVSKFDNRLMEFSERWEVDKYFSAGGYLGDIAQPFFVALPKDKVFATNEDFRSQIANVDMEVMHHLRENVVGGFNEEKYSAHVGFRNLRRYLEIELQRRYREAAPSTLALLERRCEEVASELASADAKLVAAADVVSLRRAAMSHAAAISKHVGALLHGAAEPDPADWGLTSDEERSSSGVSKWPGLLTDIRPPNAGLKLYGGAAFDRVLKEFQCAACSIEFPSISREKVANMLLAHGGRAGGLEFTAAEIACATAQSWLGPLLDTACDRLAHVLYNLFDLAMERIHLQEKSKDVQQGKGVPNLFGFVAFHAALRGAFDQFIRELTQECKELVRHHLIAGTSTYSQFCGWESSKLAAGEGNLALLGSCEDLLGPQLELSDEEMENVAPASLLQPQKGATPIRAADLRDPLKESQLTIPETPSPDQVGNDACDLKKKEFGVASGRLLGAGSAVCGTRKRQNGSSVQGFGNGCKGNLKEARQAFCGTLLGAGSKSIYTEVCILAAERFARIRELLILRSVPATLYANFLTPCRDRLALGISIELFGVSDEQFMDMFVAPGMIEKLENERGTLQKRCKTLRTCLQEFRNLSRCL
ncbi:hypothetical protein O6H91_03G024700 [Diphasiastrum complanatum]|uniref:Uncharacterized protein n=1 Tax=Diphasiastrum complanatum TaxID=34168 RepID=A0ACC2E487_DIPCM|nr:hypothetical protein O6H91_03G024700 [Diphasiastrum complanatum]